MPGDVDIRRWRRAPLLLRGEFLLQPDEAISGIMAQDIAAGRQVPHRT